MEKGSQLLGLRLQTLLSPNFFYADRAYDQSKQASGNIQTVTRSQTETAYWTLTAWDNEASMQTTWWRMLIEKQCQS